MREFHVLVLSSRADFLQDYTPPCSTNGLFVAKMVPDAILAKKELLNASYDAILLELAPPTAETYELIDEISFLKNKPLIAAVCALKEESYYIRAKRLGADFVFRAPVQTESVLLDISERLLELHAPKPTQNQPNEKLLDERLAHIFISSGIPPHIKGYQYLREAVKQSVRVPQMINNITKQLYPAVATRFDTTPSKVERAIRHAIEVAWSRGKIDNINSIYGIKVFGKDEKPTNGELIALVSDKMMIECS